MSVDQAAHTQELINRFSNGDNAPREAEELIADLFSLSGFAVDRNVRKFSASRAMHEVDLVFSIQRNEHQIRVAGEVKSTKQAVGTRAVHQALSLVNTLNFDIALLISRGGFTPDALEIARNEPARLTLLSPADLQAWIDNNRHSHSPIFKGAQQIIRSAMRELVHSIAHNPGELYSVEWRDLERILREVFERFGFDTELTRSTKDGGFDLRLLNSSSGTVYLVEVKHWTAPSRPGAGLVRSFLEVVIAENVCSGLMLSTSGFASTVCRSLTEVERQRVRLGEREKIVSLCRTYYMMEAQVWLPDESLPELLFSDTI